MEILLAPLVLFGIALAVLPMIFWIWMLVECLSKEPSEGNDKLIWVLVIFFGSIFGAILYYFIRRPERIDKYGE